MSDWHSSPDPQTLTVGQVHVWRTRCALPPEHLHVLQSWLSADELERAARFRFERDRLRFIAGRGVLRHLLSHYLNQSPQQLQFTYGQQGKPGLAAESAIHFNLSHSEDWAVYGIALSPMGIDLEALRPVSQMDGIVKRYFSEREKLFFFDLEPEAQVEAFFRAWTCKEAYIKAVGQGLTLPLQEIDVELNPQKPLQFYHLPQGQAPQRWPLWDFEPAPHLRAALTIQHESTSPLQVVFSDWKLMPT